jgi:hypothetical protein
LALTTTKESSVPDTNLSSNFLKFFQDWRLDNDGKCSTCVTGQLWCGDECKYIIDEGIWMCNGECQSLNLPCNGTCPGFMSVKRHWSFGLEPKRYTDIYWKCPSEDLCISSFHLCNQVEKDHLLKTRADDVTCKNEINKSRLVCDNPDQFDVILNCTKQNLIQCPWNKTQQCIFGEEICNGIVDCIDRYKLSSLA